MGCFCRGNTERRLMSTNISWCNETWNPICGCSKISAGCLNCWAERMAFRLACMEATKNCFRREQIEIYGKVVYANRGWNGKMTFIESALTKPFHWRKPRKIFVCSMGDLFHDSVPFESILPFPTVSRILPYIRHASRPSPYRQHWY